MKYPNYLIVFFIIISCSNNHINNEIIFNTPEKVTIVGKIINPDSNKKDFLLSVNLPSRSSNDIRATIDSLGNFTASFNIYTPTDVLLEYKTEFFTLVHPGDSIYIVFRGDTENQTSVFESVKYSGNAAKINQDAIQFQRMYLENTKNDSYKEYEKAVKSLNPESFVKYLENKRMKSRKILNRFKTEYHPEEETYAWASIYSESFFYYDLASYPDHHRYLNNLQREDWDVPSAYHDSLLNVLPLNKSKLICGSSISALVNTFHYDYVRFKTFHDPLYKKGVSENISNPNIQEIKDSLLLQGYIKFTPNDLTRQLVLAEIINQDFDMNQLTIFEKNRKLIEEIITESFLIEPIIHRYKTIKNKLINPLKYSDSIFNKIKNSSVNKLFDSIIGLNKDKVIYINFWSTWCKPCLGKFPSLNNMINEMQNKEVSFIFLCMDSEETIWKQKLAKLKAGGQHYFLSRTESIDIHTILDFNGFPYQLIIDQNGNIIEKGSHIEGDYAFKEIEILLN